MSAPSNGKIETFEGRGYWVPEGMTARKLRLELDGWSANLTSPNEAGLMVIAVLSAFASLIRKSRPLKAQKAMAELQ